MKKCRKCLIVKPDSLFYPRYKGDTTKRDTLCKACKTRIRVAYNYSTGEGIELRKRKRKETRNKLLQELINLLGGQCSKCNTKFPICVYDFHHTQEKKFSISMAVTNKKKVLVLEELKKCVLLCANCHRVTHMEAMNDLIRTTERST